VRGFWVLANTKTQKVALIILIIFSHLAVKFLGFWVFGFLDFRSADAGMINFVGEKFEHCSL
jgi:hypothetical protein